MNIYNIIKAKYLVEGQSLKNWFFIIYVIFWALILIANTHIYEQKTISIRDLTEEVKELRSEFVDRRSELMKLRMESTISKQMELKEIKPSSVPPKKIKVIVEEEKKGWLERLWD
ncbi:FtsL-like putative cell division protein [Myroides ceti]|uniref:FtsL-like putative cell division protein n=1 Tax=Paenimyroides ceti TaxID=395087 RepID=A0ABT8CV67_9FLAO|nr:FtsL-like putative cell division protein [Paenimyroides ceti]MDN3708394.1 FtsL-like putative cell division protein [Paenimyroides ceti]